MSNGVENVYVNFDGLDGALHGRLRGSSLRTLESAKRLAQAYGQPVLATVGELECLVANHGGKQCAFHFHTGEDGELWWASGSPKDGGSWSLHYSVRSAAFLQHGGLQAIRSRLSERIKALGFEGTPSPEGHYEAVARVDYAMDFRADDFVLDPAAVVTKAGKEDHWDGASSTWAGRRATAVTMGKMPGRQVQIYDKTKEVRAKGKDYWFDQWGIDPENKAARVWRVEIRLGKKHLRETWSARTLDDIEASLGDMLSSALCNVRLVEPLDENVTRCPDTPLWASARKVMARSLSECFSGLAPGRIIEAVRERTKRTLKQMLRGVAVTYSAVCGRPATVDGMELLGLEIMHDLKHYIDRNGERALDAYERASSRYHFISEARWQETRPCAPSWAT